MGQTIGNIKCPICGAEEQEVRVNKNGNLYMYCERGCKITFAAKKSRHIKATLAAGSDYFDTNFSVFGLKTPVTPLQHIENQPKKGVTQNGHTAEFRANRDNAIGRPNGQPAAVAGVQPTGTGGRGFLAAMFADDDDE